MTVFIPVPTSYYLCNKKPEIIEDIDNNKIFITLSPGDKQQFEFRVDSANSMLLR